MKTRILVLSLVFTALAFVQGTFADRRGMVWTYEYMTMPKGVFEVEYYLTEKQPNIKKATPNTWDHWLELEYGITDHWDVAVYQQFKQSNMESKSTFEYDGFKFRTRYRFAEKDKWPLDTLLYFEYIREADFKEPNILEGKVILAKDIGKFTLAYNQILKQELDSDAKTEHEYASGVTYALTPHVKFGVETKGNYTESKYYIGPTVSYAAGRFWTALGALGGLTEESDDFQVRLIAGVPF